MAEISNLSADDYNAYQQSLLSYRDMVNAMNTKYEEGKEDGITQIAIRCLKSGRTIEDVMDITGLSKEKILDIKNKINES